MSAEIDNRTEPCGGTAGPTTGRLVVDLSSAAETASLRRAVLRPNLAVEQMALAGDQNPDTAYLSVRAAGGGAVLGCVRLEPVPCPWPEALGVPPVVSWQLRAMATDPVARGTGLGRVLVEAAVAHVAKQDGDLIWCNARVSAEGFYLRQGFRAVTDRFLVHDVPEEHVGMVLELQGQR